MPSPLSRFTYLEFPCFLLACALIPIASVIFATGFFPYKPFLPGLAKYENLEYDGVPRAPFDRIVFMVVDALRSDFVYSKDSGFVFTQELINSGNALPFTAHATAPTVTMPRLKAMTTGSVPSFLDMILNFAESDTSSSLAAQDTWVAQMKAKQQGKLVMYGDDTWLKLFPGIFDRADGTTSFFVTDFTEVDNNVTRHVPWELEQRDWSVMVMHYLGMDHIGHKAGPNSPNMLPKQQEMDDVFKQIYAAVETMPHLQSTLLVLCGDHGMTDAGNHGGSAPGETSPALLFASPKLQAVSKGQRAPAMPRKDFEYYDVIEQSDLAPTLAGLLGFPVPLNNLGVFIPDFLKLWDTGDDQIQLMLRNALQILDIVKATFPNPAFDNPFAPLKCEGSLSVEQSLLCSWRRVTNKFHSMGGRQPQPKEILPLLKRFCKHAQNELSSTASNYDTSKMYFGAAVTVVASILALLACRRVLNPPYSLATGFDQPNESLNRSTCSSMEASSSAIASTRMPTTAPQALRPTPNGTQAHGILHDAMANGHSSSVHHISYAYLQRPPVPPANDVPLWALSPADSVYFIMLNFLYAAMMFGSSFVEEESTFWHWALQGWIVLMLRKVFLKPMDASGPPQIYSLGFILVLHRLAYHISTRETHAFLLFMVTITYVSIGRSIYHGYEQTHTFGRLGKVLSAIVLVAIPFAFKLAFTQRDNPDLLTGLAIIPNLLFWLDNMNLVSTAHFAFLSLLVGSIVHLSIALRHDSRIVTASKVENKTRSRLEPSRSSVLMILHPYITLFLITQTTITRIPLFLIFELQQYFLCRIIKGSRVVSLMVLLLSHSSFFLLGGSNNISTIDLSNAYNGVSTYNIGLVGLLLFASNWAGPIYWSLSGLLLNSFHPRRQHVSPFNSDGRLKIENQLKVAASFSRRSRVEGWFAQASLLTLFTACGMLGVMCACIVLRTHLFVWTVFSPKYLYAMAWAVLWHIGINVVVGGIFAWIG